MECKDHGGILRKASLDTVQCNNRKCLEFIPLEFLQAGGGRNGINAVTLNIQAYPCPDVCDIEGTVVDTDNTRPLLPPSSCST